MKKRRKAGASPRRKARSARVYRAVVIGCGRVGSLFSRDRLRRQPASHAGILAAHPRTRLVGGCDLLAERRAAFAADWGLPEGHVYADYRKLLEELRPDFVSVATYTESHARIVCAAARAGARIILCEKPMAVSVAQARRMIRVCREHGTLLAVHHERRWSPWYRLYRRMIESGELGEIRTVIGNVLTGEPPGDWHSRIDVAGGGPTLHDGTHLFDIVRYLCGEIVEIQGEIDARPGRAVEHTGRALMRLENGATAFIECGGRRGYFNFELDIQGTRGRLRVGNAIAEHHGVGPSPRYEGFVEFARRELSLPADLAPYHVHLVDELIEARERRRDSISSGHDGLAALKAVLDVYRGRRIVSPRSPRN